MKEVTIADLADWAEELQDYTPNPQQLERLEKAAMLLREAANMPDSSANRVAGPCPVLKLGDPIPEGGCGCRDNGVPVMRANCILHGPQR